MIPSVFRALNFSRRKQEEIFDVSIGQGTVRDYSMPFYGAVQSTLTAHLYSAEEVNQKFRGEKFIGIMSLDLFGYVPNYTFDSVMILIAHCSVREFEDPFTSETEFELRDETWVFENQQQTINEGTNQFMFTEPFRYNGVDNIFVAFLSTLKDPSLNYPAEYGYALMSPTGRRTTIISTNWDGDVNPEWFGVKTNSMNTTLYYSAITEKAKDDVEAPIARSFSMPTKTTIKSIIQEARLRMAGNLLEI
jgi:hypothetical protein